jgi:Relaxase/Mobilisation nuclease domain
VIIEGKSRGKGKGNFCLATHLLKKENERIRMVEARGTVLHDDLHETLSDWQTIGQAIGCKKPLYHANISPDEVKRLTEEQKIAAVDRLEQALGFTGQPRVIVEHEKKGREHLHIVWLRIDTDRMRVLSDSFNYYKHERVAGELEREFGLTPTKRALTRDDGQERPKAAPSKADLQQAERSGLSPKDARQQLTAIWNATNTGPQFQQALDEQGWILARGDRTAFVVIDQHGEIHALARRIEGVRTAGIRERLAGVDLAKLPSVKEAREMHKARGVALAETSRLQWDLATEDRIAAAGIIFADAARDIDGKRQHRAARDRGDGDMASEQKAALNRFERNSSDLQARQQDQQRQDAARQEHVRDQGQNAAPEKRPELKADKTREQKRKEFLDEYPPLAAEKGESRSQGPSRGGGRSR